MASEHPFHSLFASLGRLPAAHAESVNRRAYETLYDILSVPVEQPGRCILLRAPRAGHGKTHLLSRIQHNLGTKHEFIPIHAAFGCHIDAKTVIDDAVRRLLRPIPASNGLCVLDLITRRLFSLGLQPLVSTGQVPCQDRETALTALRTRPLETFDFNHPNAVTAHWVRENFTVLGPRLSMEVAQRCGLPIREVSFWMELLLRFAATAPDSPVRLRALTDAIHEGAPGETVLMERLEALLGMLTLLMRVVLVADELEGFSTDESAALKLAAFLGSLRRAVERLDVILSLNQDIWESAFRPRLTDGLADRLSEVVIELTPLDDKEMIDLLESRAPGHAKKIISSMDTQTAGTHARGLIRAAGMAWQKLGTEIESVRPILSLAEQILPEDEPPAEMNAPLEATPLDTKPLATTPPEAKPPKEAPSETKPPEITSSENVVINKAQKLSTEAPTFESSPPPAPTENSITDSPAVTDVSPTDLQQNGQTSGEYREVGTDRLADLLRQFRERYHGEKP